MDLFTAAKSVSIMDVYARYSGFSGKIRKGRKSTAVTCPFHEDKHPSLNLYPNNTFFCFSCKRGGSNVDLVMELLKIDNVAAARRICEDFGVEYEDGTRQPQSKRTPVDAERARLIKTNEILAKVFRMELQKAPNPKFFEDRGLYDPIVADKYMFGYCPTRKLFNKVELGKELGLCDDNGVCVFAGRYIVPIKDIHGTIVGFVGRLPDEQVDDAHPKYINSCNSALFNKRETFFNAECLLDKSDTVLVVEGVFDALSYISVGVTNVISPLGCSLADGNVADKKGKTHLQILRRFTEKTVVLAFDRDEVGEKATQKALGYAKNLRLGVLVSDYKGCKDASELLQKGYPHELSQAIKYLPAPEYVVQQYEKAKLLDTLEGQERLWTVFAKLLGNEKRKETYPINMAYTERAYDHYWDLYHNVVAMHPLQTSCAGGANALPC